MRADGEFWKAVTLKGHSKGLSKDMGQRMGLMAELQGGQEHSMTKG